MSANKSLSIKTFLKSNIFVIIFLALFIILRLPSLFEPHWYGDEGIYASIAYAIEHGKKLYIDVFDNRLPGIYYLYTLATSDSRQLVMRIFNIGAGVITLFGIYVTGKKLGFSKSIYAAMGIAVFFLGTPKIEGNIANTENFFLPLTIWGVYFSLTEKRRNLFIAGLLFGASFMIKFLPFFTFSAISLYLLLKDGKYSKNLPKFVFLVGGFLSALLVGFGLLYSNGDLFQAIQFGLLNNGSYITYYSQTGIPAISKLIAFLIILSTVVYFYLSKKITNRFFFLFIFLLFDYYAALFSGRKYEHYLLQIVPSLSLMVALVVSTIFTKGSILQKFAIPIASLLIFLGGRSVFYMGSDTAIRIHVIEYYKEFVLATLKIHYDPGLPFAFYREPARLKVAQFITQRYNTKNIYFFSDESWIYDYAHIVPPTFFIARYHQYLVPNGPERLISDLKKNPVEVIAVDKKSEVTPQLKNFLDSRYKVDLEDTYFIYFTPLSK